jgi:hypothetical protein
VNFCSAASFSTRTSEKSWADATEARRRRANRIDGFIISWQVGNLPHYLSRFIMIELAGNPK